MDDRGLVRLAWLLPILALVACDESRRGPSGPSGPAKPSCTLPVCEACACDVSSVCDPDCSACDPECSNCRSADAECVMPRDAGPVAPPGDGSGPGRTDAATRGDAGPCMFPLSQGLSEPCCIDRGIDACGAGLFCEAFDGRTQPTCYATASRRDGEECRADQHCSGGRCPPSTMRCGPGPGDRCSPTGQPCAGDGSARDYICDTDLRLCVPSPIACEPSTHQPCTAAESCYITLDQKGTYTSDCHITGTRMRSEPCDHSWECARDLLCLAPFQPVCVPVCSPTRPCAVGPCQQLAADGVGVCLEGR